METWIIKLGGSVITTKKTGQPAIKKQTIADLCAEIGQAAEAHPNRRFIVLHGAGSLAHPLVYKHHLSGAALRSANISAVRQIIANMRQVTDIVAHELSQQGLDPLPLQTSSLLSGSRNVQALAPFIYRIVQASGTPIMSGDIAIADNGTITIVSADTLAVQLALHLPAQHILFASDTPGVYQHFPPQGQEQPLTHISRAQLEELTQQSTDSTAHDVTGGMIGKLAALLPLSNTTINIFDGQQPQNLKDALAGKSVGTTIKL